MSLASTYTNSPELFSRTLSLTPCSDGHLFSVMLCVGVGLNSTSDLDEASSCLELLWGHRLNLRWEWGCNLLILNYLYGAPPPLPQRSPHIRKRHNSHNYASLVPTNGSCDVRSSVGAPPPDTSTSSIALALHHLSHPQTT